MRPLLAACLLLVLSTTPTSTRQPPTGQNIRNEAPGCGLGPAAPPAAAVSRLADGKPLTPGETLPLLTELVAKPVRLRKPLD
jgi:hypothetical protein